jgi:RNA-directed DNA polymerase
VDVKRIDNILLEKAFQDVRAARRNHSPHASIWDLSLYWSEKKQEIRTKLHRGQYKLSPCHNYFKDGVWRNSWPAADAVVLKAVSYLLQEKMNIKDCHHLKGHGGIHGSLKALQKAKPNYQKAFKSDIDSYYASINHNILINQLTTFSDCKVLQDLFTQFLKRIEIKHGKICIPKGCSLSSLDEQLKGFGFYRRYMDDWIVIVTTRAQLRKVIKITHQILKTLKLRMHPKKTFIGCINRGFAFLGIQWNQKPKIASESNEKHQFKLALRYTKNTSLNI